MFAITATLVFRSGWLFAQHDMSGMATRSALDIPQSRLGSGTSWLPDSSLVRAASGIWRRWMVSLDGAAYLQYDDQFTQRGDQQLGITDWEMLMAMRPLGGGMLHLHAMTSVEQFVIGGGGYPELLQTGGTYLHAPIHDRQHPHDVLMELAAMYEHTITRTLSLSFYAAAVGEPALGPVAYMHRLSAENDPFAPLGHHWQDAQHQSFGVVTVGVNTRTVKVEGSIFNPREADEHHPFVDYADARLDSYAGRISWAASPRVVTSAWWGYLSTHDRLDPDSRMHRYGASVLTEARGPGGGRLSSALIWGLNVHDHGAGHDHGEPGALPVSPHHASHSVLAESSLEIGSRNSVFARLERVQKSGQDLGFQGGDLTTLYDVRSIAFGFTRTVATAGRVGFAVGARGSVNFIPETLLLTYGTRAPAGFAVYTQVRPNGPGR